MSKERETSLAMLKIEIASIAEVQIDTITEEIFPHRYDKAVEVLNYLIDKLSKKPANIEPTTYEQIKIEEYIAHIPGQLKRLTAEDQLKELLNYLTSKKEEYVEKDKLVQEYLSGKTEIKPEANILKAYSSDEAAKELKQEQQAKNKADIKEAKEKLRAEEERKRVGKEINIEQYLLITKGILTEKEAELFSYQELNTYQAYYAENEYIIEDIFKIAKSTENGLEELAKIQHEKMPYLFKLRDTLRKQNITLKEIVQYTKDELEILTKHVPLFGLLGKNQIFEFDKALSTNNIEQILNIMKAGIDHQNISQENKLLAFEWLIEQGNKEIVRLLLKEIGPELLISGQISEMLYDAT